VKEEIILAHKFSQENRKKQYIPGHFVRPAHRYQKQRHCKKRELQTNLFQVDAKTFNKILTN
jgi:hypothetical protein